MNRIMNKKIRDISLDYVKGILVISMVIYHIMNYFTNTGAKEFEHVRFVTGSFIFISGYIISYFYERRFFSNKSLISRRIIFRGLKLLAIFTMLNVLILLTGFSNPNKPTSSIVQILNNLHNIYIFGDKRLSSFQILLPISYNLILFPLLFLFKKKFISILIFFLTFLLFYSILGVNFVIFDLMLIGITGFYIGVIKVKSNKLYNIENKFLILTIITVCIYYFKIFDINLLTYIIGVTIILKLIYNFSITINLNSLINKNVILLGKYTLICYIAQIIFLHGLSWTLSRQKWGFGYQTVSIFILTNITLLGLCYILKYFRYKYNFFNKLYRFIFL